MELTIRKDKGGRCPECGAEETCEILTECPICGGPLPKVEK